MVDRYHVLHPNGSLLHDDDEGYVEKNEAGFWVTATDYAKLEAELAEVKTALNDCTTREGIVIKHGVHLMKENQRLRELLLSVNHDNCDHLDDAIMMIQQALEGKNERTKNAGDSYLRRS